MASTNRIRLYDPEQHERTEQMLAAITGQHDARRTRGFARLMSDAGQHELAAVLMDLAKREVRGEPS